MAISHLPRCTKPTDPDRAAVHSHRVGDASPETAEPCGEPVDVLRGSRYAAEIERHGTAAQHKRARRRVAAEEAPSGALLDVAPAADASLEARAALQRMTIILPHIQTAARDAAKATPGGRVLLAIIAKAADGSGRITCDFESGEFLADLESLVRAIDASRPTLTADEARRGWFLAAAWARLAQARGGAMQEFDEDYESTKNARGWLESIGVDVNADPPVVIPEALRASRGETGPTKPGAQ